MPQCGVKRGRYLFFEPAREYRGQDMLEAWKKTVCVLVAGLKKWFFGRSFQFEI